MLVQTCLQFNSMSLLTSSHFFLLLFFAILLFLHFVLLKGSERFHSYPPWALAMAYSLIVVAMLPLPIVFIVRHFNLISDGSNKLSVSYRKGMMKDISNLEEQDEQRFILSKNPSEAPSPMPAHRAYLGPGGTQEMTNTNYGTSTKTGYQNIGSPESELWWVKFIDAPVHITSTQLEGGAGWQREVKREVKFTYSIQHTLTPELNPSTPPFLLQSSFTCGSFLLDCHRVCAGDSQ